MVSELKEGDAPAGSDQAGLAKHKNTITLEILRMIKEAQSQHGLKHGDYHRYRSYCSRRIRRLRKSLNFVQATSSKTRSVYQCKKMNNEMVFGTQTVVTQQKKDPLRYLLIPLMQAERAWSYAMALKQEANTEPRKRFHLIRRLNKAVFCASELERLCNEEPTRCDARTKLESQAYAAYLRGIRYFETERWQSASESLKKAEAIYVKLYQAVSTDEEYSSHYQQRIDELKPTLRYCAFNIGEISGKSGGAKEFLDRMKQEVPKVEDELLASKLDQLLLQTREKQAVTFSEIAWLGRTISIKQEKIRAFLLNYQELQALNVSVLKVSQLEKLLFECRDCIQVLRESNQNKTPQYVYLQYLRLNLTIKRNLKLAESTQNQIDSVRLYEIMIASLNEIKALPLAQYFNEDGVSLEKFNNELEAEIVAYKAFRCFHIGKIGKLNWKESVALLHRSSVYCVEYLNNENSNEKMSIEIKDLFTKVEADKYAIYANSLISDTSSEGSKELKPGEKAIIERLDEYIEDNSKLLSGNAQFVSFPPSFRPIPCKPLFFDLALNHIQFPVLESEIASPRAGTGITGLVKGWLTGGWKK